MLVIFDCDGVLVDSETLASHVFSDVLANHGVEFSAAECFRTFKGHTLPYCLTWLAQHKDANLPESFLDELSEATARAFDQELNASSGIFEVLEYLKSNAISYCVASNGSHSKIDRSLAITGLQHYFAQNCRFSVEDVVRGKPAPDLFLYAAESMGVPASFCCVVEDSSSGIVAANAAGMSVYKYWPESNQEDAASGDNLAFERVRSMAELLARLKSRR